MKFDFTTLWDRKGKDASAIDNVGKNERGTEPEHPEADFDFIPMWVADMNFATSPEIPKIIKERLEHPLFGYFNGRPEYYESIIRWRSDRNGFTDLKEEYIHYENGVHGAITSAVQILSQPGDNILLHSPTYVGFSKDVEGLGRNSIYSELVLDEDHIYRMNYEDMERKIIEYDIHLVIFCSPHNPSGRVWEHWELERALEIFEKHDCYVISDEIWADLVFEGQQHIPLLTINEWIKDHGVGIYAPTKTFNLGGVVGSYSIIYNDLLRKRINNFGESTHYNNMNLFSMYALIGAYSKQSEPWVEELLQVLEENVTYAVDNIREHFKGVDVSMPQGTYMIFLDVSRYMKEHNKTLDEMLKAGWRVGVGWQDGRAFNGPTHIRVNLALPKERVEEAMRRMKEYVFVE